MKKAVCILLVIVLMLSGCIVSYALESQNKALPAPSVSEVKINDGVSVIELIHSLGTAEEARQLIYNFTLSLYKSEEALLNSPEKYLASPTAIYLEISRDTEEWTQLRKITGASLVLTSDEIASFTGSKNGVAFIRLLMASENHKDEGIKKVYIYTPSDPIMVCYNENTVIPTDVPLKFSLPESGRLSLFVPERKGYIFDGWSQPDGVRINEIGSDSPVTLQAHFIPRSYEINYVIKTNISYSSGFVNNTHNPISYTVGTAKKLYAINSPIAGWSFDGWYESPDFSGKAVTEVSPSDTGDKLFYAKWISDEEIAQRKYEEQLRYIEENHLGDPDGDGKITAKDARYILRCVVGLEDADYEKLKRVDYYNNNRILAENARITLRIAVGLDDLYEVCLKNGLLP